jgi:hypothetical protein
MQRAEARLNRTFVGSSGVCPSPHSDDVVGERKAKVFELVRRQQGKGGRPVPASISRSWERSWTPSLPDAHTLEDPLSDVAGRLIVAMNAIPTWTREKRTIYVNLLEHLKKEGYYFFRGSLRTYPIAKTGGSIL